MKTIAIIGATGFAVERMIPELAHSTSCKVVSIQGRDRTRLQSISKKYSIPHVFCDTHDMLSFLNYDAIYICTPPFLHAEHIKLACAISAASILCEKPLVLSLDEAVEIQRICESSRKVIMIGHHIRHQKAIVDLLNLLSDDVIGEIVSVHAQWSYRINPGNPHAKWKFDSSLGGESAMNDSGIHIIDMLMLLFGVPVSVMAYGYSIKYSQTIDTVTATLNYANMFANITACQVMCAPNNDLVINGTNGRIEVVDAFSQEYIKSIRIYREKWKCEQYTYDSSLLYKNQIECLLGLKMEGLTGTTLEESLHEIRTVNAIHLSIKSGKSVVV